MCLGLTAGAVSGCSATGTTASPSPTKSSAKVTITPANGLDSAKPNKGIEVTVADGTITEVTVKSGGETVTGTLNAASTRWHSRFALNTDTQYLVRATAVDAAGRTVTRTSRFRTLTPKTTFRAQIFEGHNVTYGVGMPIILQFSRPVSDRRAVERSLRLWSSKRVVGAWYWDGDQTLYFRTRTYWPAHTKVRFVGHLDGVEISSGVYGTHTLRQSFTIGRSLITIASTTTHRVLIYRDRHLWASWPISTGKTGHETPNGTYLTIEKENPARMVGDDYDIEVPYSVRFTWSGAYLHSASWSVGEQGYANVSHGCVNLSPAHAKTYYALSVPGDPVTITDSPKAGSWDDGWTVWFLSWNKLVDGSALHKAVRVGPDGSTWVTPSSLKPAKAKAPLGRPRPDNSAAS